MIFPVSVQSVMPQPARTARDFENAGIFRAKSRYDIAPFSLSVGRKMHSGSLAAAEDMTFSTETSLTIPTPHRRAADDASAAAPR